MTQTKLSIPDEVYDGARDLDESTSLEAGFEYVAAWARNEALREAAEVARTTPLTLMDIDYEAQVIAEAILELVEEHVTIPNPDHTPLGKYEVID